MALQERLDNVTVGTTKKKKAKDDLDTTAARDQGTSLEQTPGDRPLPINKKDLEFLKK